MVWSTAKGNLELGAEAEEGDTRRWRNNAHADGASPTVTVATTVFGFVVRTGRRARPVT
jgi:hypothetical protein